MGERKHAHVIRAWADGAEVEWRPNGEKPWEWISKPSFSVEYEYRVKRDPKLQAVIDAHAAGQEVEWKVTHGDIWHPVPRVVTTDYFDDDCEYRIKPHKHQACIDAHAAGKLIQCRCVGFGDWKDLGPGDPLWLEHMEYRIRPRLWDFVLAHREGKTLQARFTDRSDTWADQVITERSLETAEGIPNLEYRIKPETKKCRVYETKGGSTHTLDGIHSGLAIEQADYFARWLTDWVEYEA